MFARHRPRKANRIVGSGGTASQVTKVCFEALDRSA